VPLVPPPKSPHFTRVVLMLLTPTASIPAPISEQTMVSPTWIEDPLRYMAVMKPPSIVPTATLPEVEPVL
jgi:hypothetical protein